MVKLCAVHEETVVKTHRTATHRRQMCWEMRPRKIFAQRKEEEEGHYAGMHGEKSSYSALNAV